MFLFICFIFLQLFKNVKTILSSKVVQKQANLACGLLFAAPGLVSVNVGGWENGNREGLEPQLATCLVICLRTSHLTSLRQSVCLTAVTTPPVKGCWESTIHQVSTHSRHPEMGGDIVLLFNERGRRED